MVYWCEDCYWCDEKSGKCWNKNVSDERYGKYVADKQECDENLWTEK